MSRKSVGHCEAPINPPEGFEPPKCDPVDLDTVEEWRDKLNEAMPLIAYGGKSQLVFLKLLASMNETINDCQGLNDPEPERDEG